MRSQQSAQTPPFCLATLPAISMKRWAYLCAFAMSQPCLDGRCLSYCRSLTTLWISACLQTRKRVLINAFTVRALRDGFAPARGAGTISPLNLFGGVFCQRNVVMIQLVTLATGSCSPHWWPPNTKPHGAARMKRLSWMCQLCKVSSADWWIPYQASWPLWQRLNTTMPQKLQHEYYLILWYLLLILIGTLTPVQWSTCKMLMHCWFTYWWSFYLLLLHFHSWHVLCIHLTVI